MPSAVSEQAHALNYSLNPIDASILMSSASELFHVRKKNPRVIYNHCQGRMRPIIRLGLNEATGAGS